MELGTGAAVSATSKRGVYDKCDVQRQTVQFPLVVVAGSFVRLSYLKLDWAQLDNIVQSPIEQLLAHYCCVYQAGVGTIVGCQADMLLREGTKSVFKKCRSVAYVL